LENVTLNKNQSSENDELDEAFQSSIPGFSRSWDSVASRCPNSGAMIHFCSMQNANNSKIANQHRKGSFSLLAITDTTAPSSSSHYSDSILSCRSLLASHVKENASLLKMKHLVGRPITSADLLSSMSKWGLPLLSLPESSEEGTEPRDTTAKNHKQRPFLKEVVIPYFDNAEYADGSILLSKIARLQRPKVGLYNWSTGSSSSSSSIIRIRPLPTAAEDHSLPPPSLIFHCEYSEEINVQELTHGATTAKIGCNGRNGVGQLMLRHADLVGLDVRYCPQTSISSSFSEAEESLLAGSLEELQSTNTLLAGGGGGTANDDDRLGKADCWVEVRANIKRPFGFWHRSSSKKRTAKAPNLPYE
jgi:hypothetical protein